MIDLKLLQNSRILVVDDDAITRSLLMLSLKKEGYQVEEATNGAECLQKYPRLQPNLVLLDAMMPEMDGFECCQELRQLASSEFLPILMITFLDDNDSIDKAFNAGATDYIPKPIHWGSLRQRVKTSLQSGHLATLYAQQQSWQTLVRQWIGLLTAKARPEVFTALGGQILSQLRLNDIFVVNAEGGLDFSFEQGLKHSWQDKSMVKKREFRKLLASYLDQNADYCGAVSGDELRSIFDRDQTLTQNCFMYLHKLDPLPESSAIVVALSKSFDPVGDQLTQDRFQELSDLINLHIATSNQPN